MQAIKANGGRVACYPTECYWQDIGRFDDFEQASVDFAADPARFLGPAFVAGTAVFALLLATLLSYGVARTVTRPLGAITATMRVMTATGDLPR